MTIALAASFPWGVIRKAVNGLPGSRIEESGVILATDSRWTYEGGSPEDSGQKLWPLVPSRGIGAVFAGDVQCAEESLEAAAKRLEAIARLDPPIVGDVVSSTLSQVFAAHSTSHKRLHPPEALYVLVGMADMHGRTAVVQFSHSEKFAPVFVQGVRVIGWPSACEKLRLRLPEVEQHMLSGGSGRSLSIDQWAVQLAGKMFGGVIEPGEERTVGGGVQLVTISAVGWRNLHVTRALVEQRPIAWTKVTAEPGALKRLRQQFRVPPLASGALDLRIMSLIES